MKTKYGISISLDNKRMSKEISINLDRLEITDNTLINQYLYIDS